MHFNLGPAEKIFGPGGVRIRTQGTAELKLGGNIKKIDNPSLSIRNRKTTSLEFDEKINLSVNGKVGDKVNMNLNYNTDATFDFDTQNLKLRYDGKDRSEEHTSELQSRQYLVCRLLLEKKLCARVCSPARFSASVTGISVAARRPTPQAMMPAVIGLP